MAIYIPPRPAPAAPPPAVKAGPLGPGAGVLQTEYPLAGLLSGQTDQDRMKQYAGLARSVAWIRAAEEVVGDRFSSVTWHLEDTDGDTFDPSDATALEQDAFALVERPMARIPPTGGQRLTRTALWKLTSRMMGACGSAFWLRDQPNAYGIPAAFKFIAPWRMWPDEDANGNLTGWHLDRRPNYDGIPLRLDQVVHFMLEPSESGHFGIGLVETAVLKANISVGLDRHVAQVLAAGGRLSGIMSPKANDSISDDQYHQLERDIRTITEQPDAARRVQVLRGPIDFTATTMTLESLRVVELLQSYEDGLLGLWRVPKSMLGTHDRGKGLGASTVTQNDDEVLWVNAVEPRLTAFREALQGEVLDLYADAGEAVTLVLEVPTFDDQKPSFDVAASALSLPLTNDERRALVGLDPFEEDVIGSSGAPLGSEVWMPSTQVLAFSAAESQPEPAPEPATPAPEAPVSEERASAAAGEVSDPGQAPAAKASPLEGFRESMKRLRAAVDQTFTPPLRGSVQAVLEDQRAEVAARLRDRASHVSANRADSSAWWDGPKWDHRMRMALSPGLMGAASTVSLHVRELLPQQRKASTAVDRVLERGAARVTGINETTRQKLLDLIARALDAGWSVMDLADAIETGDVPEGLAAIDLSTTVPFDAYRAELIARTELMDAYNQTALGSYGDAGLNYVQAIDGTGDEECAARDGQVYSLDEAGAIDDHPNGTLDWVPVIDPSLGGD